MDNAPKIIFETPTAHSLIEPIHINCLTEGCLAVFQNTGNLHMHMLKHHKISIYQSNVEKRFFCPEKNCKYNISKNQNYFSTKKLLRQHYIKVHAIKTINCRYCTKLFASSTLKNGHEKSCLKEYKCMDCNWTYTSRESLLTHCRRKNHSIRKKNENQSQKLVTILKSNKLIANKNSNKFVHILPKICVDKEKYKKSQCTQTNESMSSNTIICGDKQSNLNNREFLDNWNKRIQQIPVTAIQQQQPITLEQNCQTVDYFDTETASHTSSQNDKNLNKINFVDDETSCLNYFTGNSSSSALCHIETQTELFGKNETLSSNVNSDNLDSLLYTNMYTQTCDDIFSELGLINIQTQTNWQSSDYGEMFVSTETQTSCLANFLENPSTYTQTVFDENNPNDDENCGNSNRHGGIFKEFGNNNNSQSTQTAFENCLREID